MTSKLKAYFVGVGPEHIPDLLELSDDYFITFRLDGENFQINNGVIKKRPMTH